MEYADGSSASLAVAINAFDCFFYRGLGIQADGEILCFFGLNYEDIAQGSKRSKMKRTTSFEAVLFTLTRNQLSEVRNL